MFTYTWGPAIPCQPSHAWGVDEEFVDIVYYFATRISFDCDHLRKQGFIDYIHKLRGKIFVCDCADDKPCIRDVLAAEVLAAS